jgi:hypothetical protein
MDRGREIHMTATNGTGKLSNVGVTMVHVDSCNPVYPALLARCHREDRRLSLIEHNQQAVWCNVEWLDELKKGGCDGCGSRA